MITSIEVDGFKTLSQFRLELNPGLNILVGPNGSGKTNIISFFEFLAHLVDKGPSDATSHLGGAGAVFRRLKDSYESHITASVRGCYLLPGDREAYFSRRPRDTSRDIYALYEYSFRLLFSNESVEFATQQFRFKEVPKFVPAAEFEQAGKDWAFDMEIRLENDMSIATNIRRSTSAFADLIPFFRGAGKAAIKQAQDFVSRAYSPHMAIPSFLGRFSGALSVLSLDLAGGQTYNIIPSRVKIPEDSAKPPGIASDGSGLSSTLYSLRHRNTAFEQKLWGSSSTSKIAPQKKPSLESLKDYFRLANNAIDDIEVTNDPFNNQLRVTFKIKNGDYTASVPLSLMSDGTLKWLTLLTAALSAPSVFSIEEPENYLHPTMQGQFVTIMRDVLFIGNKQSCTLMTTHSETLLNHCQPSEIIVVSLKDGKSHGLRCKNEHELSDEIEKTGFGLGYYYIAGALHDE
jgi:predicted ATPase